jgi:hypothetical protein
MLPAIWREAIIVPIFKSGDSRDPANYRFISLLCAPAKIFASIILKRIENYVVTAKLLRPEQIGFRAGYSTAHHALTLHTLVQQALNNNTVLHVAFIDFKKAFDTISRPLLWQKLRHLGIHGRVLASLMALYSGATARVRTSGGFTKPFQQDMGVRQGCVLAPLLFVLFIRDLSFELDTCPGVKLGNVTLNHLLYADDLVLMAESEAHLQMLLNTLDKYAKSNRLTINQSKSKVMSFSPRQHRHYELLTIDNVALERVTSYKYLGYMFSANGNWNMHDAMSASKAQKTFFAINRRLAQLYCLHDFSIQNRLLRAKAMPVLLYGAELCGISNLNLCAGAIVRQLKTILSLRSSTSSTLTLFEAGYLPLPAYAQEISLRFFAKLQQSANASDLHSAAFTIQLEMANRGLPCWGRDVLLLLDELHLTELWQHPIAVSTTALLIHRALQNMWFTQQLADVGASRLQYWLLLNRPAAPAPALHLTLRMDDKCTIALSRLRTGSSHLDVVVGAWNGLPRDRRTCRLCGNGIGDERHFLFECAALNDLRATLMDNIPLQLESTFNCTFVPNIAKFTCRGFSRLTL